MNVRNLCTRIYDIWSQSFGHATFGYNDIWHDDICLHRTNRPTYTVINHPALQGTEVFKCSPIVIGPQMSILRQVWICIAVTTDHEIING